MLRRLEDGNVVVIAVIAAVAAAAWNNKRSNSAAAAQAEASPPRSNDVLLYWRRSSAAIMGVLRAVTLLIRLFWAFIAQFVQAEPRRWRPAVDCAWWYRASPLAFSLLGVHTLCSQHLLTPFAAWFPWRTLGVQSLLQGPLSYMADVGTWGRRSVWKQLDCLSACILFSTAAGIPLFQLVGWMNFPPDILAFNVVCVLGAIVSKVNSSIALGQGRELTNDAASTWRSKGTTMSSDPMSFDPKVRSDTQACQRFLHWHTAWHLIMPGGPIVCLIWLQMIIDIDTQ